jgi:ATP-dependent exoDNAse (exonuclease V) beta subunit
MTNQMFDEEIVEKKTTKTNLICQACGKKHEDDFWHKRCKDCRKAKKPATKKLKIANAKFTGRTYFSPKTQKHYPSVTSILHPFGIDYPEFLLKQYASRGTIVHAQCEEYHKSNGLQWLDPREVDSLAEHVKRLDEGNLKLSWNDCDYVGFRKEFGHLIKVESQEEVAINDEYEFAGRYDACGTYKGEPAIIDYKTASDYKEEKLNSYFMQLSAYAKTVDPNGFKYLVVIPLNPKSKKGYEEPYVSSNIDKHFEDFLAKRDEFRGIFNM